MPKYWESHNQQYNRLSKYRKPTGTAAGNAAAIRSLQRKVAGLKPELQTYQFSNNITFNGSAYTQNAFYPSEDLAGTTDRDLRITGDSWTNKVLKLRLRFTNALVPNGIFRVLVVVPKKAGTTFTFTENSIPDPDKMAVLRDATYSCVPGANLQRQFNMTIPLRNMKSTFVGTTPEKGSVQVYLIMRNFDAAFEPMQYTYQLTYADK